MVPNIFHNLKRKFLDKTDYVVVGTVDQHTEVGCALLDQRVGQQHLQINQLGHPKVVHNKRGLCANR